MAKHNKWTQIKRKKAITDQKKAQVFTKLSKLITLAARDQGGDAATNSALSLLTQKAKAANMTKELIERAIKKGTGEAGSALDIQEVIYEGYAPHGVAVIVRTLTENRTRTVGNLRHVFSKYGGGLGDTGTVAYLFHKKGIIEVTAPVDEKEDIELRIIDTGVEDFSVVEIKDGLATIECILAPQDMHRVKTALEKIDHLTIVDSSMSFLPTMEQELAGDQLEEVLDFLEMVEEDEDVDEVFSNIACRNIL